MNNVLQLKGRFEQRKSSGRPGPAMLPAGKSVNAEHLLELAEQLRAIDHYWKNETIIKKALVSVYYKDVVAKSNRIGKLLSYAGCKPNDSIVGVKFAKRETKHIITHCIPRETIVDSAELLEKAAEILNVQFDNEITKDVLEAIHKKRIPYNEKILKRNAFAQIVVDAFYVEAFGIERADPSIDEQSIVSIYDTGMDTNKIMEELNIPWFSTSMIDNTTFLIQPDRYKQLVERAPYLVAMAVKDISDFVYDMPAMTNEEGMATIPKPKDEPVIGVIDSLFDETVYFSEWVDFENKIDPEIEIERKDYYHGTKVSSLIVDGPSINPNLDDGCGRFRVRHFGVAKSGRFSSFSIIRAIKEIITDNPDIKVWNLSLGSAMEINRNFISPEAAALDKIQYENDVIFIIAGTNKEESDEEQMKIGAPADSINSLVVNAVDCNGKPASYSRRGPVLAFYNKPDISCFGGDKNCGMKVCGSVGAERVMGTSYAAPWIARKMAYLIHVIGLSREAAKALIIDAAVGWTEKEEPSYIVGYGEVPQRIEDIISCPDDEIRFIVSGISEQYDTYNYNIPVPLEKGKHPYIARATMCYFPNCTRNQGVDYTNTELDLHFGRMKNDGSIDTINDNKQGDPGIQSITESMARSFFRKWDNVKYIVEYNTGNKKTKKAYERGTYGVSLKTKERLKASDGRGIPFGLVVTLKEINGINRIDEFIRQCYLKGWLVTEIDIENKLDIYVTAEEDVVFED